MNIKERGFDLPEDACQVNMENDRMRLLEAEYHKHVMFSTIFSQRKLFRNISTE